MSGHISRMDGLIDMEQKWYEFVWCQIHYMTLTVDPIHYLDLGVSRSNFDIAVFQERRDLMIDLIFF